MKKILFFTFIFYSLHSFSQDVYNFDYYTKYEYKINESDSTNTSREITYSNSKDKSFLLRILEKNNIIFSAILYDYSKENTIIFKNEFFNKGINDITLFYNSNHQSFALKNCKESKKNYYEINYYLKNDNNCFNIRRFKNNKRKKLINESFYETIPSEITKYQHYNFGILATSLWCDKFTLKNEEIISYSYFIENGKRKHIRKLLKIEKTDFTLNISKNNTTN